MVEAWSVDSTITSNSSSIIGSLDKVDDVSITGCGSISSIIIVGEIAIVAPISQC